MAARSAGILLYRRSPAGPELWIAHMGGPFWAKKDERAWSIPKGEFEDPNDEPLTVALREFGEEMGSPAPDVTYELLGEFRQKSGKTVVVFVAEAEFAPAEIASNTFELEWPPRSGRMQSFPEVDDARWVSVDDARVKLVAGQVAAVDALLARLDS